MQKYLLLFIILLSACSTSPQPAACTVDAKICPDGSAVGRIAPDCEFAPCPIVITDCDYDPEKSYVARSADQCATVRFTCESGKEAFFDDCGCGCKAAEIPGDAYCTPEEKENQACTKEYRPVCGWANENIQCIKYPCATTYGNRCSACAGENVAYVTDGECPS